MFSSKEHAEHWKNGLVIGCATGNVSTRYDVCIRFDDRQQGVEISEGGTFQGYICYPCDLCYEVFIEDYTICELSINCERLLCLNSCSLMKYYRYLLDAIKSHLLNFSQVPLIVWICYEDPWSYSIFKHINVRLNIY